MFYKIDTKIETQLAYVSTRTLQSALLQVFGKVQLFVWMLQRSSRLSSSAINYHHLAASLRRDDVEMWDDSGNLVEQEKAKKASIPKDIRRLLPACSYLHALGSKICQTLFFEGCGVECAKVMYFSASLHLRMQKT